MKRSQINTLVKLFKFAWYGKDTYILKLNSDVKIYLFYFQDKPKGWRIVIYNPEEADYEKLLKHPSDMLRYLMEYSSQKTYVRERRMFRSKLNEMLRSV